MTYFISENQLTKGPYTLADLRQTNPDTLVWREGLTAWLPLRSLPEWAASETPIPQQKRFLLSGSLASDWRIAALATLIAASLFFLKQAIPFNRTVYDLLRSVPLLLYYWGLFLIGRSFNLKGMRQAVRWLAFGELLALTGWITGWVATALGIVSVLAGLKVLVDLWLLRAVSSRLLIAVLVITQALNEIESTMSTFPFYLSSVVYIANRVCMALLFFGLMAYSSREGVPPGLGTPVLA